MLSPTLRLGAALSLILLAARAPLATPGGPPTTVPFPQSLRLLDVLEGTRRTEPRSSRSEYPDLWNGAPAFDPEESAALLALELGASEHVLRLLVEMRGLALVRLAGLAAPPGWSLQPNGIVAEFRARLHTLVRLIPATRFQGHALLTGTPPVLFLLPRSTNDAPQRILTEDLTPGTIGLAIIDIADRADTQAALDLLDTAIVTVNYARARFAVEQQRLLDGPAEGGLIEVERILDRLRERAVLACDMTMNNDERALLDLAFQSDVLRLDELAARAQFDGIALLCGGRVLLQGAGALPTARLFALPNTRAADLDVATDITDTGNAFGAIQLIDGALAYVSDQRAELARTREELQRSTPHLR